MSTLMIMAGGTGGHVFPALAVAQDLRERGVEVVWLGTRNGIEAQAVPQARFDLECITIKGLRGKGLIGLLRTPLLLLLAMAQTTAVLLRRRPAALLGMGGFVAGPGGLVAWLLRRPLLIHESNAAPGLTNRLLAKVADRVMTGFPGVFPAQSKTEYVGNPVRSEIAGLDAPQARLADRSGPLRLLVVGGSQGARVFNERLPEALAGMAPTGRPVVWHQTGRGKEAGVADRYRAASIEARVEPFLDDMAEAYAWADLVICRAGAMTVAEVCVSGSAAVFVPFPYAVGDHQAANARFLVSREAGLMVREEEFTPRRIGEILSSLDRDRARLVKMAQGAHEHGRPDATRRVVDICMEVLSA